VAAFALTVRWAEPDAARPELDPLLERRGHVSQYRDGELLVICLGTVLGAEAVGAARAGQCDASIVAAAYRRAGDGWAAAACGDFAAVIVERSEGRVQLVRNHAGTRPLFYRLLADGVRVGSDYASVGCDPAELDPVAVAAFLGARNAPTRVMPAGVSVAPIAHVTTLTAGGSRSWRYWDPRAVAERPVPSIPAAAEELRRTVAEVVGEWTDRFSGPIGCHLTGGLDSALVTNWACRQRRVTGGADPVGLAWQPAASDAAATIDQRALAAVAERFGIRTVSATATAASAAAVTALDPAAVPFTSTLLMELPVLAVAAGEGLELILSGWGGDELVSFNGRHHANRPTSRLRRWAGSAIRRPSAAKGPSRPFGYLAPAWRASAPARLGGGWRSARDTQLDLLGSGHLSERTDAWSAHAAGFGLQHAFPLLDRRVIEFALSLPEACYPRGRAVMREALRGDAPEWVRTNPDKSEPGRTEITSAAVRALVDGHGVDLPVRADRLAFVDVDAVLAALGGTGRGVRRGKLVRAVQLLYTPEGTPLREAVAAMAVGGRQ